MTSKVRDLTYIAMMATLIIVLGHIPGIPLGFIPVPIVLQNLGIMLAGAILGAKRGTVSVLLFLLLGTFIPAFTGGNNTIPVLMGPTAGYVVSWIFVPLLIGIGLKKIPSQNFLLTFLIIWLGGFLFVDFLGAIWLAHFTKMPFITALWSNLAFIPGDTIKALLTRLIAVKYSRYLVKD